VSYRRQLAPVVAIQSLGVASSFAIVALLARVAGPEVQGEFALYKSLIDVQVAFLTLGLPSGFIYVINKGYYSAREMFVQASRYAPAVFVVSTLITAAYLTTRSTPLPGDEGLNVALVAFAAGATTYWALVRGIVLTLSDGVAFAWVTALSPLVLMVVTLGGVGTGAWSLPMSFAVSALVAVLTVLALVAAVGLPSRRAKRAPGASASGARVLVEQSGHTLLQAVFLSGAVFSILWLMQLLGAGVHDLGQFSVTSLAVVGPNLLVGMVAPILYSRWSRSMDAGHRRRLVARALRFSVVVQIAALVSLPLVVPMITFLLGEEYRPAAVAMCIVLLAVFPLAATRVIAPALQATGSTAIVSASWGARLLAPVVLIPAFTLVEDVVKWAALVMAIGEYVALVVMLVLSTRERPRRGPEPT
jgi:O-antigen/teichoic acid export membrane protein